MPLARYAAILLGFQRFLTAWEAELRDAMPARLQCWLSAPGRLEFLAQDLTGGMWRESRLRAEQEIGADPLHRHQACQAARQTFEALISTFEPLLG